MGLIVCAAAVLGIRQWQIHSERRGFPARCLAAEQRRDWRGLESLSRQWLRLAPDESVAWFWLGEALRAQHRFEDAARAYQHVPLDRIRGIDAAVERMQLLFHVFHDPVAALEIADRLLRIDDRLAAPVRNRIYYFAMTSQRPALLREIRRAIEIQADVPAHFVYLMTLEEIGFSDADQVTAQWLEHDPDHRFHRTVNLAHRARNARAAWLTSPSPETKGRLDQLIAEVSEAHRQQPRNTVLLEFLMTVAMDHGDADELGRLLTLVPDSAVEDPVFWLWRGRYALQVADIEDARRSLQRAIELHPLSFQARHEYAALLRTRNHPEQAGAVQALAAQGTEIVHRIRRLKHAHDVDQAILDAIADYARQCGDWSVANAVYRRREPALAR